MFSGVVLSLRLQEETGTEIVRSQGTIGEKVTIAQASSSLISVMGVTGSVLPLDVCFFFFFKLPKTTVEQTQTQVYLKCPCTHTLAGGWSSILHLPRSTLTFLSFCPYL